MGVSKNRGTPKWMVYNGKPYQNGMIWGYHYFRKQPYMPFGEFLSNTMGSLRTRMYLKKAMERFGEVEATEKLKEFTKKRGER